MAVNDLKSTIPWHSPFRKESPFTLLREASHESSTTIVSTSASMRRRIQLGTGLPDRVRSDKIRFHLRPQSLRNSCLTPNRFDPVTFPNRFSWRLCEIRLPHPHL